MYITFQVFYEGILNKYNCFFAVMSVNQHILDRKLLINSLTSKLISPILVKNSENSITCELYNVKNT